MGIKEPGTRQLQARRVYGISPSERRRTMQVYLTQVLNKVRRIAHSILQTLSSPYTTVNDSWKNPSVYEIGGDN